ESLFKELGGAKGMPEWKKQLVQRIAFASISCEVIETKMLQGMDVDQELHRKCVLTLATMLRSLGLDAANVPSNDDTTDDEEPTVIRRVIVDSKPRVPASN